MASGADVASGAGVVSGAGVASAVLALVLVGRGALARRVDREFLRDGLAIVNCDLARRRNFFRMWTMGEIGRCADTGGVLVFGFGALGMLLGVGNRRRCFAVFLVT